MLYLTLVLLFNYVDSYHTVNNNCYNCNKHKILNNNYALNASRPWNYEPQDLPSLLLDKRIIFIGEPITSNSTESIINQLLYLDNKSKHQPISIYINSGQIGQRFDREDVSIAYPETLALSIYDVIQFIQPSITTINLGKAFGTGALILSVGDKGKRFVLPHSQCMLVQPSCLVTTRQAADVAIVAREVLKTRETIVNLIANRTGKSPETVAADVQRNKFFNAQETIDYGLADNILTKECKDQSLKHLQESQ